MRAIVCAIVGMIGLTAGLATSPAGAQGNRPTPDRAATAFWKSVRTTCDATAAKPPSETGQRIAKIAIEEFHRFGGHKIDSDGRLFRFGLTEAENEEDDGGNPNASLDRLGWWQVMKYWRALFGNDAASKLEVRGYTDASTLNGESQVAPLLRTSAAALLRLAETVTDPEAREFLREAALRAAATDTSWSAAFISYVVKQAGIAEKQFQFSNAHRAYIYGAFATSVAEINGKPDDHVYRACPLTTRPRVGDLLCQQRESSLADTSDAAVRERIRLELDGNPAVRTIRRTHCEVVAHVDVSARKVYTIGGNVNQSVSARKLNLRGGSLRFSAVQRGNCSGLRNWTMPQPGGQNAHAQKCSLNDKKWFVLLQVR